MKICRISDAFPPPWSGLGPGPWALSRAQVELGHEVHVIGKYHSGCESIDRNAPFRVYRIRARSYAFELLAIKALLTLDRRHHFDLIHTHGASAFLFHLLAGQRFSKPIFMSIHSVRKRQFIIYRQFGLTSNRFQDLVTLLREQIAVAGCDHFLPVSQGLMRELHEYYGIATRRMTVIGNGADDFLNYRLDQDALVCRSAELDLNGSPCLLFVGALNGRKDIGQVIRLLPDLASGNRSPVLIIVGSGQKKEVYKNLARSTGVADRIRFIDNLPPSELALLYHLANVFVFPTCYEGLPKVVIEAMASGLPVVCSRIPGNDELVSDEDNGFLFDNNNQLALRRQLVTLLEKPDLARKMGQRGRVRVADRYTWKAVAKRCHQSYIKLLAGPHRVA